jgi:hypothetical protein
MASVVISSGETPATQVPLALSQNAGTAKVERQP